MGTRDGCGGGSRTPGRYALHYICIPYFIATLTKEPLTLRNRLNILNLVEYTKYFQFNFNKYASQYRLARHSEAAR